jgi:peptidoglycan hydrolase-like protein with peptidoglycan-binding domain
VISLQIRNALKIGVIVLLLAGISAAKTRTTKHSSHPSAGPTSKTLHKTSSKTSSKHHAQRRGAWKRHGQQEIKDDRALEIQQALIREKYLDGTPNGQWDSRTQQAMARYQSDHGWQSKVTPDSRAIIKLGLGPSHSEDMRPADSTATAATTSASVSGSAGSNRYKR